MSDSRPPYYYPGYGHQYTFSYPPSAEHEDYDTTPPFQSESPARHSSYTATDASYSRHGSRQDSRSSPSASTIGQHTQRTTEPSHSNVRIYCLHPDCADGSNQPMRFFSRKADVIRHTRSTHDHHQYLDCPKLKCQRKGDNAFTRADHLEEHLRQYHREPLSKKGGK